MPKVTIEYRRTKTIVEDGSVEIEVDEQAAATLRRPLDIKAWATFTMVNEVKNWREQPAPMPKLEITAKIDDEAVPMAEPTRSPTLEQRANDLADRICKGLLVSGFENDPGAEKVLKEHKKIVVGTIRRELEGRL